MKLLFELIILTSIWVLAIKVATLNGMIFQKLGEYGEQKVKDGKKIFEALLICQWCMPSVHSLIGYAFAIGIGVIKSFSYSLIFYYPLCVCGSSLVCGLIWTGYLTLVSKKEYYDNAQKYYYLTNKKLKEGNGKS